MSKELQNLGERLCKARIDDDYVETDLRAWSVTLEKLPHDVVLTLLSNEQSMSHKESNSTKKSAEKGLNG